MTSDEELGEAIEASEVVISLVPFVHHARIIKVAIANRTNVVTTSYVSPAIRALEDEAKKAGVVVINEVGGMCCFAVHSPLSGLGHESSDTCFWPLTI